MQTMVKIYRKNLSDEKGFIKLLRASNIKMVVKKYDIFVEAMEDGNMCIFPNIWSQYFKNTDISIAGILSNQSEFGITAKGKVIDSNIINFPAVVVSLNTKSDYEDLRVQKVIPKRNGYGIILKKENLLSFFKEGRISQEDLLSSEERLGSFFHPVRDVLFPAVV